MGVRAGRQARFLIGPFATFVFFADAGFARKKGPGCPGPILVSVPPVQ